MNVISVLCSVSMNVELALISKCGHLSSEVDKEGIKQLLRSCCDWLWCLFIHAEPGWPMQLELSDL